MVNGVKIHLFHLFHHLTGVSYVFSVQALCRIDLQGLAKTFLVEYLTGPLGPGTGKPSKIPGF